MRTQSYPAIPVFLIILVLAALLFEYHQQRKHRRTVELLTLSSTQREVSGRSALPFSAPPSTSMQPVSISETEQGTPSSASLKININTASSLDLQQLPGIGPARAQAIIEYRQAQGGFKSIEELMNIRGIGEKTLQTIKNQLEL